MNDIKIVIATREEFTFPQNNAFLPVQVGKKIAKVKISIQGDDEGENISSKQPNYSEVTALYWAWRNLKNYQYIGLNHHRRYFCHSKKYQHSVYLTKKEFKKNPNIISIPKYKTILKKHDIIKVKPFTYYHSVEAVLTNILSKDDLFILENLIKENYPEYYSTYIKFMRYNNKISSCNMFISNFNLFDKYSTWLFDVLFEYEKRVQISPYIESARIFGFISEALFNVFCLKHKLKVKYLSIYVIRDDVKRENHLIYTLKNIRRNISFFFNKPKR